MDRKKWAVLYPRYWAKSLSMSLAQIQDLAGGLAFLLSLCPSLPTPLGLSCSFWGCYGVVIADLGGMYTGTSWRWLSEGALWVSEVPVLEPES